MSDQSQWMTVVIRGDTSDFVKKLAEASSLGNKFAGDLTRSFEDAAIKGRALSDVLRSLALSLSAQTLQAAISPISKIFGNALAGLLGSAGIPTTPFASGGVIAAPIAFPLGGSGRRGVAGEAGPEAILPLSRGADGRLGVRAEGGGGQAINVTFNVTAQDADSFRRSEGQIAAMLNRAVGRGQRNL